MGIRSFLGRFASCGALLALVMHAGVAAAATQSSSSSQTCRASSSSSSTSSAKACSFDSSGVHDTTSLATQYGNTFSNGIGSGSNNGGAGGDNTTLLGSSSKFAYSTRDTGRAAAGAGGGWNAWISFSQSNVAYQYQPLQSSGHVSLTLAGADYTFKNNMTLGLVAGWDTTRIGTTFNGGNLNSNGYMVGPYFNWRITPNWSLDLATAFGHANMSQTDNSVGSVTGNYGDKRALGSASLAYSTLMGKWILTGRGSLLATEDKYDTFTLSNGVTINSTTNRLTQVRAGGQAMYNGGVILPYAGLYYFNDIQRVTQAAVGGSTPANDRDGFQAQLGLQIVPKGQVYGGLMFSTDFGRSQVKNDLFMGNIGIRF